MKSKINHRKKILLIIFIVEVIILIILLVLIQAKNSIHKSLDEIPRDYSEDENIEENEDLDMEANYRNIVVFGLDTRDNSLKRGNSDTIMVVSINNKTKDIKLASIYRDTYVSIPDKGYNKINAAYATGGYSLALSTINRNFDLNIKEYVTVNFMALVDIIDLLGGITLDIEDNEVQYINGYVRELNKINNTNSKGISGAGTQTLNGTQATAYARIRYTAGADFRRTERQRIIIQKIFDEVKASNLTTITSIINTIFPQILTNLDNNEILNLAKHVLSYDIIGNTGFPFEKVAQTYKRSSYVFPINLKENVTKLHEFLFDKTDYVPTNNVNEYSDYIENILNQ